MVKKFLFYLLLLVVSATLFGCKLSGRVTTPNGDPVSGVTLTLSGNSNLIALTGINGEYSFALPDEEANYTITPSKNSYAFNPEQISVEVNQDTPEDGIEGLDFTGTTTFRKILDGDAYDYACSVQQTTDGGYIVAGYTAADAWLIKTDASGNAKWKKTWAGTACAYSAQQTTDGGYIVAGLWLGAGSNEGWLAKTDANGNEEWSKSWTVTNMNRFNYVQQTADGGYIVVGDSFLNDTYYDIWVMKTDSSGNEEWRKIWGGDNYDFGKYVQQTTDGGFIIAGSTASYGAGAYDAWLIKTDASGNEEWQKTLGGGGEELSYTAQQTSDGGYIVAGKFWIFKTDTAGNEEWNKRLSSRITHSVKQTSDGGYILAGTSGGVSDAWLSKIDAGGNEEWQKIFGGSGYECASSIQPTADGGYVIAGYTWDYVGSDLSKITSESWLIKTNSFGNDFTQP